MDDISVAKIGSPSSPILVMLREYEGRRFVDVRRYYVDKSTKETKPTKKGITLNARALAEIRDVFDKSEKAITDWLQRDPTGESDEVKKQMLERQAAADRIARKERPYNIQSGKWRSPNFFACESNGETTTISLNDNHPFVQKLQKGDGKANDSIAAIGAMLAAYYHTKFLFDDAEEIKPTQFFEAFEYEWGLILNNYSQLDR
jgi:hypothetical protein